ncbi:SDR family NAD(P)-dependent oxidoreductase [Mycobacterium talmoniae]|uniref:3-oxoacyl-ACP reductase n=1 Tax=Mycobacterium talmoniae TaxID=1858794 RepID=A0A1S1NJR4_9MYCO|nr:MULTISPECIES: SDR family oxidoreductase [Mycobacterium]OHV06396.1 3-oxoacyl-ACP reductase [Mycobacterium talmoniae]PQM49076.1 3-oxoacyl-[acyl-carrier-protein] reductase FabG [Mycobacterium talmoniae]TDH57348.1 SDR family oxidoreductase [Mycobacterium eburneum]
MSLLIEPTLRSEMLADRVAIVTGGSRGIGGATATVLAANGARVVIADVDEAKAADTAAQLNTAFGACTAEVFIGDLVAPGVCDDLVAHTLDSCGGLDIVVNNAGYAWDGGVHALTDDQFQAMLDIHLVVPFRLARACAPVLRAAAHADGGAPRHRKTVMVSSMAGEWGLAGAANYAAAKAGLLGLMRSLAQEWGTMRVNVNAVAFGVIQTRFALPQSDREVIHTGGRDINVGMPAKQAQRLGITIDPDKPPCDAEIYAPKPLPGIVLGRTGTIREAADAILWLCSPLSDYITGQTIAVNGGARGGMS